jgi:uncharacterized protein
VTPLIEAAGQPSGQVTALLLHAGARADQAFGKGQTPLMTAARAGNEPAVAALLAAGAAPDAREGVRGQTALMWAAALGHAGVVRQLLAHHAGVDLLDWPNDQKPMEEREGRLPPGGAPLPAGGLSALQFAARNGQVDAVAALLEAGARVNQADAQGWTPLLLAIVNTHYGTARLLLAKGANPGLANREGIAPLYAAVDMRVPDITARPLRPQLDATSNEELLEALLAAGADPNQPVSGKGGLGAGATPFMRAARAGDVVAMKLLLEHGAKAPLATSEGANALMIAAGMGRRFGARAQAVAESDLDATAQLCLAAGIDANAANAQGETALHAAVLAANADMVRVLLRHGARGDLRNKRGFTPLDIAQGKGRPAPTGAAPEPEAFQAIRGLLLPGPQPG